MEVLLLAVMAVSNIVCFIVGAKVGQTVSKGEEVEVPTLNPMKAIKEHEAKKEAEREAEYERNRLDTILRNIDSYDGTSFKQEDVPRR